MFWFPGRRQTNPGTAQLHSLGSANISWGKTLPSQTYYVNLRDTKPLVGAGYLGTLKPFTLMSRPDDSANAPC